MSWDTSRKWRAWEPSRTRRPARLFRSRAGWVGTSDKDAEFETGFAVKVGEQVVQEARSKRRLTSQFTRLTAQSGLRTCPVVVPGDGFAIVQTEAAAAGPLFQDR